MPILSGGGGGSGLPLTGGTLTGELAVNPTATTNGSLVVKSPDHDTVGALVLGLTNVDVDTLLRVYSDGSAELQNESSSSQAPGNSAFVVTDLGPVPSSSFIIKGVRGGATGGVGAGGFLKMRGVNAAPADASLLAGDVALWYDATNGASKLMVKAKQADGTVKTAAVALA